MKAKVTKRGVQVPRRMLGEAEAVEIRKEKGKVIIISLPVEDPILGLGENPVTCNVPDASEEHNRYIYGEAQ